MSYDKENIENTEDTPNENAEDSISNENNTKVEKASFFKKIFFSFNNTTFKTLLMRLSIVLIYMIKCRKIIKQRIHMYETNQFYIYQERVPH